MSNCPNSVVPVFENGSRGRASGYGQHTKLSILRKLRDRRVRHIGCPLPKQKTRLALVGILLVMHGVTAAPRWPEAPNAVNTPAPPEIGRPPQPPAPGGPAPTGPAGTETA